MVLPLYLAQTPLEMSGNPLPVNLAYLACHFSPGGRGLSNLPPQLPPGSILILDDSNPMTDHDPELIQDQLYHWLSQRQAEAVLLDFQRPDIPGQQELAKQLHGPLPCPVAVSELYAQDICCPVFLSPVPPDRPLAEHLAPWKGREIWLEVALDGISLTLTEEGCNIVPLFDFPAAGQADSRLHCHYTVEAGEKSATFRLWRTRQDLEDLLTEAETVGVAKAIGLWQELGL